MQSHCAMGDNRESLVAQEAAEGSKAVDEALRHLAPPMLRAQLSPLKNSQLQRLTKMDLGSLPEAARFPFERRRFPDSFQEVPLR